MKLGRAHSTRWTFVLTLAGFLVNPMVTAVAPLLVIPTLTSTLGASGWGAIAAGQGLGLFAMTVAVSGWGTVGPPLFARTAERERAQLYLTSLSSRVLLYVPACGIGVATAMAIAPDHFRVASALMVPAAAIWALNPTWFYVAANRSRGITLFDSLPKLAVAIITVGFCRIFPSSYVYPVVTLAVGSAACVAGAIACGRGATSMNWRGARGYLREHAGLNLSRVAVSAFTTLTVPIVAVASPSSLPSYAAVDRLRTLGATGLMSLSSAFQGWLYLGEEVVLRRQRTAAVWVVGSATVGAVALVLLGPWLQRELFSGVARLSPIPLVLQGAALVLIGLGNTLTFHYLAPTGRTRRVAAGGFAGSVVGLCLIPLMARLMGTTGASMAVAMAEAAVVSVLVWPCRRVSGRHAAR